MKEKINNALNEAIKAQIEELEKTNEKINYFYISCVADYILSDSEKLKKTIERDLDVLRKYGEENLSTLTQEEKGFIHSDFIFFENEIRNILLLGVLLFARISKLEKEMDK